MGELVEFSRALESYQAKRAERLNENLLAQYEETRPRYLDPSVTTGRQAPPENPDDLPF